MLPQINQGDLFVSTFNFLPELVLCLGIVVLLLLRLFRTIHVGGWALFFVLFALLVSLLQWVGESGMERLVASFGLTGPAAEYLQSLALPGPPPQGHQLVYGGLLVYDYFAIYLRIFLYLFAALVIWLTRLTKIPDREDSADFYCLLLGSVLGMALMAMSAHLLMVFIAIEMASLPSYALAGFLKGRRQSSEAALKYVVYGGGAAGIMLYGISLLAGRFGSGYLPEVTAGIVATFIPTETGVAMDPTVIMGTLFLLIGIAFKLAAVPFHFWCPDVFEGASAEVAGFLSVASKGAALALLARLTLFLGGLDPLGVGHPIPQSAYLTIIRYLIPALAFFAALTATFGNLAAYVQTNLKRLLAYSTIAHAGYMLMALCTLTRGGVEAMLFYLVAYLFMNLGAFAIVAFLRNLTHSEDLNDFRGLVRRAPFLVVTLSLFLLSLLGIPPLVGFAAKFQIFAVLYKDGNTYYQMGQPGLGATLIGLLVVGGLNTVLSAFYYIKVMKVMILDSRAEDLEGQPAVPLREPLGAMTYSGMLSAMVLLLGVFWGPIDEWSRTGISRFRQRPGVNQEAPPPPAPGR